MCGISGIVGQGWQRAQLEAMVAVQHHRGPDYNGVYIDETHTVGLGHNRLSIIDSSPAGHQPMTNHDGSLWIVFNGEVYNYLELASELTDHPYHSRTDTEVVLAAYERWGEQCVEHFVGMFAFAIWDVRQRSLFAARDRFGVKPFYYAQRGDGTLLLASEIKALHCAGVRALPDQVTWSTYLTHGLLDHTQRTFWSGVSLLEPGHLLTWKGGETKTRVWYDLAQRVPTEPDDRPFEVVQEEYLALMSESVRLRFRSDVPVGINLSGGLDSSTLLGLVQLVRGTESDVKAFTFATGDLNYDELSWVEQMLEQTRHPLTVCRLNPDDVPALAESVQADEDEPFGGLPTLAYARLFEQARSEGVVVLLDGQGMDEQWAGYDYYLSALNGQCAGVVQGTKDRPVRPECMVPEFRALAEPFDLSEHFDDTLRNLQYRDARYTKIPRALRYNDRISMRSSVELREPFLDHRLFELAMRQPRERKIANGTSKWLLRQIARQLLPVGIVEAPKRALQTPQREWLRGPLRSWTHELVENALAAHGGAWLERGRVRSTLDQFLNGAGDNSFWVWQWISIGLSLQRAKEPPFSNPSREPRAAAVHG